jgi:hypothetical protein
LHDHSSQTELTERSATCELLLRYSAAADAGNEAASMTGPIAPAILATVDKHDLGGTIVVVVGVALVVLGAIRMAAKAASAFLIPLAGLVVLIVGILLFTRTI